eukprot:1178889-Prorocentrum_minimum.AAC.1
MHNCTPPSRAVQASVMDGISHWRGEFRHQYGGFSHWRGESQMLTRAKDESGEGQFKEVLKEIKSEGGTKAVVGTLAKEKPEGAFLKQWAADLKASGLATVGPHVATKPLFSRFPTEEIDGRPPRGH